MLSGSEVEAKNMKSLQTDRWTDQWTDAEHTKSVQKSSLELSGVGWTIIMVNRVWANGLGWTLKANRAKKPGTLVQEICYDS